MLVRRLRVVIAFSVCSILSAVAQPPPRTLTVDDYARAERWMNYNVDGLVQHTVGGVQYLPDGRVFYRDPGVGGVAYMLADPAHGTQATAFDNAKLSVALSAATKKKVEASKLGVFGFALEDGGGFAVITRSGLFHCNAAATKCAAEPAPPPPVQLPSKATDKNTAPPPPVRQARRRGGSPTNASPDKKLVAFIRDNNLWVRTVATGEERALTTDGVANFGYATDNAGWQHSAAAVLTWSADGKKIATFQQDQRKTGLMYLVPVTNRHPVLEAWPYPLVGDADVTMIEPVVIDVASAAVVRLKTLPLEHRSMECDDISCGDGQWTDVEFSPDDRHLAFVATSRDHKDEWLRVADTANGDVREVFHEHADTYYGWQSKTDWKYLPESNEFLWVSERSNWAQLYLYDLTTGKLKNQITHGDGPVADLMRVDQKDRVIYFEATNKEKGEDPYFVNYYRVGFDGKGQQLLTPEVANHAIVAAPDGSTFVDAYSTVDTPQIAVLRDNTGKLLMTLGKEDISRLLTTGWKPPTPITVKARDGKTPLYGFLFKPTNFDATKKYPVVDLVYPGPQDGACGTRSFRAAHGDLQALADLGFITLCIDGMGNPHRSKSFHDAHASKPEDMGDDTIPDQVSGIKDLAARFAWIDLDRVGMWGHSGGGNATVSALFHFPDFFKVGIAESGNHDNRDYEDDWDERWAGLEKIGPDGKSNYDAQANQNYARNLKGHLLLAHGTMDDNVPPNNTLLVVDALIKANKDFDLIMIPNAHHGYAEASQYMMRRRWDYFVRYLAGNVPPLNYRTMPFAETQKLIHADGPSDGEADAGTEPGIF
ncbi:MAG: S9 family peptidase [Acidobacteriota bacterium]|nr:S9 family peptidase [Acidobacteriota bacterium]